MRCISSVFFKNEFGIFYGEIMVEKNILQKVDFYFNSKVKIDRLCVSIQLSIREILRSEWFLQIQRISFIKKYCVSTPNGP